MATRKNAKKEEEVVVGKAPLPGEEPVPAPVTEEEPKGKARKLKLPGITITHFTGRVQITIDKPYAQGSISEELRAAVEEVLANHK